MKKISLYMMALLSMGFVACTEDYTPEVGPQSNPQEEIAGAFSLNIEGVTTNVNLADCQDETIQLFKVTTENVETENYTVVLQKDENTQEIVADAQGNVSVKDLNTALIKLVGATTDAVEYNYCAKAVLHTTIAGHAADVAATSNTVKTQLIQQPAFVDYIFDTESKLYLTGNVYDWGGTWVPMVNVNGFENLSWLIIYLHANEEFKFAPQQGWGGDFGALTVNDEAGSGIVGSADGSANLKVVNPGWYLVAVDADTKTVTIAQPNIWLFGTVSVGGVWEYNDANLFTIPTSEDAAFVSPAFTTDGEVRMAVQLAGVDWWRTEFVVTADGAIDYRAGGGDQARVAVKEGQKAYITFGSVSGFGTYK